MKDLKRTVPVLQSLTRPILMLGGERENIIVILFLAGAIWLTGKDLVALGVALAVWGIGLMACRVAAKNDPYQTRIFLKSLRYESFYPARERLLTPGRGSASAKQESYS